MKRACLLIALCAGTVHAHAGTRPPQEDIVVNLTRDAIVAIKPGGETSRNAFLRNWGQFEVRIPRNRFPVSAPNCRSNVILRMAGVVPDAPRRKEQLAARWVQWQALHAVAGGKREQLPVRIAPGPYMKKDAAGRRVLEYCNAYFMPP